MKREFLKNLGIEDKETIDKILDENSMDIGNAKGEVNTLKAKVTELENSLANKDSEISDLTQKVADVNSLKEKIKTLEESNADLTTKLDTEVSHIQKTHAIENRIRDRKGKNVKAIKALLDEDKITYENNELGGIDEQLDALASAEDSSMLFGEAQTASPSGTQPHTPPPGGNGSNPPTGKTFVEAIASAINSNK